MDKIELALRSGFDVELEEVFEEVDGERIVCEVWMNILDPASGLLILPLRLDTDSKPSRAEIELSVDTFLANRAEHLANHTG